MAFTKVPPKEVRAQINPQEFLNNMLFPVTYGPDWQDVQREKRKWGEGLVAGDRPEDMGETTWSQIQGSPVYQYDKSTSAYDGDVPITTYPGETQVPGQNALGTLRYQPAFPENPPQIDIGGKSASPREPQMLKRMGVEVIGPKDDRPHSLDWQLSPYSIAEKAAHRGTEGTAKQAVHGNWWGAPSGGQGLWMSDSDNTLIHELGHAVGVDSAKEQRKTWSPYLVDDDIEDELTPTIMDHPNVDIIDAKYLSIPLEADQRTMEFVRRMGTTREVTDPKTGEKTWVEIPGNELTSEGRGNRNIVMNPQEFEKQWVRFGEYLKHYEKQNPHDRFGLDSGWSSKRWEAINSSKGKDGSYYEYMKWRAPGLMETRPRSLPENIIA